MRNFCFNKHADDGFNQSYVPGRRDSYGWVSEETEAVMAEQLIPELRHGFILPDENFAVQNRFDDEGFALKHYRVDVPGDGRYLVKMTIVALSEVKEAFVFVSRRHLLWHGALDAGQTVELTIAVDVSPFIPSFGTQALADEAVDIALAGRELSIQALRITACNPRMLFLMGDSTLTDQIAHQPYHPGQSYSGWGQMLSYFLPEEVCVCNQAHSGLTTESFRAEGHYALLRQGLRKDDIVLIQFGHNDQKLSHLQAEGGYRERLLTYIDELEAVGARPVLVTPLARNSWRDGCYDDLLFDYATAVRRISGERKIKLLDLHAVFMAVIRTRGLEGAKSLFFPGDFTHTNDYGAYWVAGQIARMLSAEGIVSCAVRPDWESPKHQVKIRQSTDPLELQRLVVSKDKTGAEKTCAGQNTLLPIIKQLMSVFHFFAYNADCDSQILDLAVNAAPEEREALRAALLNGLLPASYQTAELISEGRVLTLEEFLHLLILSYERRKQISKSFDVKGKFNPDYRESLAKAVGLGLAEPQSPWQEALTEPYVRKVYEQINF